MTQGFDSPRRYISRARGWSVRGGNIIWSAVGGDEEGEEEKGMFVLKLNFFF